MRLWSRVEFLLQSCGRLLVFGSARIRNGTNEPLKFMPGNGDMAKYKHGYEDHPLEDGTFTDYDLAEHEEAIFHEESKQKVLDGLGEDIINLRPLRMASKSFVDIGFLLQGSFTP